MASLVFMALGKGERGRWLGAPLYIVGWPNDQRRVQGRTPVCRSSKQLGNETAHVRPGDDIGKVQHFPQARVEMVTR